jgi:hypothetical protein
MPEDEKNQQQTEQTPTGYTVPVPKRDEFFGNLKKAARPSTPQQPRVPPKPNPRGRPTKGK